MGFLLSSLVMGFRVGIFMLPCGINLEEFQVLGNDSYIDNYLA